MDENKSIQRKMAFSFRSGIPDWYHDFPKLARDSGFYFNMRRSKVKVDWNRIGGIDIDRVIKERDFFTIDQNINNVIDYHLESEYDVKILDPNFVKLFRLAQLSVEYLLYCKQYLDHSVVILKDELKSKIEDNVRLKKELVMTEEDLNILKEKSRDKHKIFEKRYSDSQGEIFKCPYCPKTFISAIFTNSHISRRHPSSPQLPCSSPAHDHYKVEAEKLQDEIKNLKERLNQTERVIRNETGKLYENLDSKEKINGNNRNNDASHSHDSESVDIFKDDLEKDKKFEEEHRKYREDINNLTTMLFSEIRNLKEDDKKSNQLSNESEELRELLKQQENEIQRLTDQVKELSANKVTPDMGLLQSQLNSKEEFWQSKIDQLECQHVRDIAELSAELKVTQQSAEKLRTEYINKLKELTERTTLDYNAIVPDVKNNDKEKLEKTVISDPVNNGNHRILVHPADQFNNSTSESDNSQIKKLQNESKSDKWSVAAVMTDKKTLDPRMRKNQHKTDDEFKEKRSLERDQKNSKVSNTEVEVSTSQTDDDDDDNDDEDESESVTVSESEASKTNSSEESQTSENSNISEETTESDDSRQKNFINKSQPQKIEELKEQVQGALDQKLADLGIDPEIDGISKDSYQELMNTVKQHRSVNSRKYKKFNEIRHNIIQLLNKKLSTHEKSITRVQTPTTPKKSPLNKLMSNVKMKAIRALSLPSFHDTHTSQMSGSKATNLKQVLKERNFELLPKKIKQQELRRKRTQSLSDREKPEESNFRDSKKNLQRKNDVEIDKAIIHRRGSYSKIIDEYSKDIKMQTSTPVKLKDEFKNVVSSHRIIVSSPAEKSNDFSSLSASPKENKSVLKSTSGGIVTYSKKKVLFDLEKENTQNQKINAPSTSQLKTGNESESDEFDISSIADDDSKGSEIEEMFNSPNRRPKSVLSGRLNEVSKVIGNQSFPNGNNQSESSRVIRKKDFSIHGDSDLDYKFDNNADRAFFNSTTVIVTPKTSQIPQPAPRTLKRNLIATDLE